MKRKFTLPLMLLVAFITVANTSDLYALTDTARHEMSEVEYVDSEHNANSHAVDESKHALEEHSQESQPEEGASSHGGGMEPLFFVIIALVIGSAIRHFFQKSFLPYTVLLLIFGLGLGFISRLGWLHHLHTLDVSLRWAGEIDPHLILFVFLPTLIFEAAFAIDIHTFKKTVGNAMILAVPGIIIALSLTAALVMGMKHLGIGFQAWSWSLALMFGAVASATDPVAVVSLLKGLGASKKLGTLIEGESLLNDGTAIVIFMVFFLGVTGAATGSSPIVDFFRVAVGGVLLGAVIGGITIAWVKRVFNDAMVEISVIVVAAYLTFYIAEDFFHISGVLGLVSLGLAMASVGKTRISPGVEHFLHEFWELAAFIANTLIFIIVGVVIALRADITGKNLLILLIIYVGIAVIRAIVIAIFFPVMKRVGYGLSKPDAYVLWWGALRGAIGLALALVVAGVDPKYISHDVSSLFLTLIAGIVTLTLVVNATTIGWLVNKLGLTKVKPARALMIYNANNYLRTSSENALERIKSDKFLKTANWNAVSEFLPEVPANTGLKDLQIETLSETRSRILEKEKSSYWGQFKEGLIGPGAVEHLSDAINDGLDAGGTKPLSERGDLEALWNTPKLLAKLQNSWVFGRWAKRLFFERLSVSYDTARGLLEAQEESLKLVESMYRHLGDGADREEEEKGLDIVVNEIKKNKVYAQNFIRTIRKNYPEIYNAISTRQAIRTVLNYEMRTVERLQKNGRVSSKEAGKMIESIEERMKKLQYSAMEIKLPKTREILAEISWLKSVSPETYETVVDLFQHQVYSVGEKLIREDTPADSLFVVVRGNLQDSTKDTPLRMRGPGDSLGVINILTNSVNKVTVTAESPVTVLRIKYMKLQKLLADSPELVESLWDTAARNIAEPLLKKHAKYSEMSESQIRKMMAHGLSYTLKQDQEVKTKNMVVVLLEGSVYADASKRGLIKAPAVLFEDTVMASMGRVLACTEQNKQ
ncbi:MAG: cation:proton antiporter [Salinivirgaceae bacterium]|jgi:NhaP-type Na+/H+ or K+/H+ antiporter/CRP-like cAMP-binding protein|nr:cation:proton antiporter [Salinivirgaceae bacterium]